MALLEVKHLGIRFGGLRAVNDVTFDINYNEIVGLIGPNGAGKTTVFNLLTNVYAPTEGEILVDGVNTRSLKQHQTVDFGLARTFQNIRLFKSMSALENIKVGFHNNGKYGITSSVLRLPSYWKEEGEYTERAMRLLEAFDMADTAEMEAGNLPYGRQRKLEICRALAASPKLLLLDEPAAGMNPTETQELMDTIRLVQEKFSISILLIEHDMNLVMGICERLIVLNYGKILATGTPEQVRANPEVIGAYLGSEGDPDAAAN